MRRPGWLTRESERWETDGLISADQRRAILDRYPPAQDEQLMSVTFVWLAWLVGGFGFVLLVAWNWAQIPTSLKLGATTTVALGLYASAWLAAGRGAGRRAEHLAFAGAIAAGAVAAAVTEWLGLAASNTMPMLIWALVIAVTALVAASPPTTALGAGVLLFWAMTETGRPPAPWAFIAVFPFLALALERRSQVYAAGAVTMSMGIWAALIALDSWRSSAVPGVMLLMAGSAIDLWAHLPEQRRPAFARAGPALVMMVLGLTFQGAATLQGGAPPALWGDPAVVLPAVTLLGSLTLVCLWPSAAQAAARWRPAVFGGYTVVWVAAALAAGGQTPVPVWWSWVWTALPSVALVVIAVSAVREGQAGENRWFFAVGVLAAVALVVMHVTGSANRFGRSALVLLAAAAVLWGISRGKVLVYRRRPW